MKGWGTIYPNLLRSLTSLYKSKDSLERAKYIDRKIWKPTSVKKEISLIIKQTALYS